MRRLAALVAALVAALAIAPATSSGDPDTTPPGVVFARALDETTVKVDFSEPLDPNSVQATDFKLTMADVVRRIKTVALSPDGRSVLISSSGWLWGEAGYVEFTAPGAVNDSAGNPIAGAPKVRVAAAPGDFVPPIAGSLRMIPKTICLTHAPSCPRPGGKIRFVSSEAGKAIVLVKRSNVTVGTRAWSGIKPGSNVLTFTGRLGERKLRAGRYRLLVYMEDRVGNVMDNPPLVLFSVRRATK